jgi:hypothetical protein
MIADPIEYAIKYLQKAKLTLETGRSQGDIVSSLLPTLKSLSDASTFVSEAVQLTTTAIQANCNVTKRED